MSNRHNYESVSANSSPTNDLESNPNTNNAPDLIHSGQYDAIAGGGSNCDQVVISDEPGPGMNQQPRDMIYSPKGMTGNKDEKIELKCAPPLPKGKIYHVYFLYRTLSPDKDWVINVATRLENEGFYCGYHERDFMPGETVMSNIDDAMRKSLKVIIVISPDFLKSGWTKYETQLAKGLSLEQSTTRLSLIPVLLRQCQVPAYLQDLTYLDAQGEEYEWWPRLKKAITCTPVSDVHKLILFPTHSFSGRTQNNEDIPWLLDLVLNSDHDFIVTDGRNKELKKFSLQGQLKDKMAFKTRPDCLALTDEYLVTVTFPHETFLCVVDTKDSLSIVSFIPCKLRCAGISSMKDGRLIIGNRESGSVILCTKEGKILQEIKNGSSGEKLFRTPTYVRVVDNRTV